MSANSDQDALWHVHGSSMVWQRRCNTCGAINPAKYGVCGPKLSAGPASVPATKNPTNVIRQCLPEKKARKRINILKKHKEAFSKPKPWDAALQRHFERSTTSSNSDADQCTGEHCPYEWHCDKTWAKTKGAHPAIKPSSTHYTAPAKAQAKTRASTPVQAGPGPGFPGTDGPSTPPRPGRDC